MSPQQPSESKTSPQGGAGSVARHPGKPKRITQKSDQDAQRRRDAHSNSASAGRGDDADDLRGGQQPERSDPRA